MDPFRSLIQQAMSTSHSDRPWHVRGLAAIGWLVLCGALQASDVIRVDTELPSSGETRAVPAQGPPAAVDSGLDVVDGFPVDLGTPANGQPYTPTVCDIDGGASEILVAAGNAFAIRGDGSFVPGWPTSEQAGMGQGTTGTFPGPTVAQLIPGGTKEVVWSTKDWFAGSSRTWTFNAKDAAGFDLTGFPQETPDIGSNALTTPVVVGDTDGDQEPELWVPHTFDNGVTENRLSRLNAQGVVAWTRDLPADEDMLTLMFGDLQGTGTAQMFTVTFKFPGKTYTLYAFEPDGQDAAGYPKVLYSLGSGFEAFGPPLAADLDNDGDLEVLIGDGGFGVGSRVRCFHHTGTVCGGFPIEIDPSSQMLYISLGDVAGDDAPEVLAMSSDAVNGVGTSFRLHVHDVATGAELPGWPAVVPDIAHNVPVVAEVTGDAAQDIAFTTFGGSLWVLEGDGQVAAGYPKGMGDVSVSGAAVGDIDGDGLFEIVASTWQGMVYAWNTPGEARLDRADWPMRGANCRYTGVFGDSDGVFSDGFESGDTSAWDVTTP